MSSWVLVGTLPGGPSGVANVLSRQTVGVSQQTILDIRPELDIGVEIDLAPIRVTSPQTVGVSQDELVSGTVQHEQSVGVALSSKVEGGGIGGQSPISVGAEIKEIHINLTQTTYAISAAGVNGTWTNKTNAVGANNGTFSTTSNSLTVAPSGTLDLAYAAQVNKTDLVISSVHLYRFWKNVAGLTSPCTWGIAYSFDGTNWTTIATGSGSFDQTVTPGNFDMTSIIGQDWNKLSNLRVRFTYTGVASATPSTLSVDAVRLIVEASKVDTV